MFGRPAASQVESASRCLLSLASCASHSSAESFEVSTFANSSSRWVERTTVRTAFVDACARSRMLSTASSSIGSRPASRVWTSVTVMEPDQAPVYEHRQHMPWAITVAAQGGVLRLKGAVIEPRDEFLHPTCQVVLRHLQPRTSDHRVELCGQVRLESRLWIPARPPPNHSFARWRREH